MFPMSKTEILAVHKRKLQEFLEKLDIWEPLLKGELKCAVCKVNLSVENIGLIIPRGDTISVCCSSSECFFELRELRGVRKE